MQEIKKWEDLTIQDDFLFKKVMKNSAICSKILERILQIKIGKIVYHEEEKSINMRADAKGIRLDVYVQDEQGTVYNIEMQTTNTNDELKLRSRYYQDLIDLDLLQKGQSYAELTQTYIIFICPFDLFGAKRHIYTFRNSCIEEKGLELDDKTTKIFLNSKGELDDITPELKAFLNYTDGKVSDDPFIVAVDRAVDKAKASKDWRLEYMILALQMELDRKQAKEEARAEALAEGLAKGHAETQREIVQNMLKKNYSYDEVAEITGMSTDNIKEIASQLPTGQKTR